MTILLIDTSQPQAHVVLARDLQVVTERTWESDRGLGVRLLQEITDILREGQTTLKELDRIAVCKGPGSFSALRTGVVVATMLSYAAGIALVGAEHSLVKKMLSEGYRTTPVEVVVPIYEKIVET